MGVARIPEAMKCMSMGKAGFGVLASIVLAGVCCVLGNHSRAADEKPLNVLLLTLDDMNWKSTGADGCKVPGITPHIDRLASEGVLFTRGYIMTPMCGPSRAALLTGRYPHCSGMMGHGQQPPKNWAEPELKTPSLSTYLHQFGYRTGAILKNKRCAYLNTWDVRYNELPYGLGHHDRNPETFYQRTKKFIEECEALGKPFFLYANPIDPHDPWPETDWEKKALAEVNPLNPPPGPGRKYKPEEVEVPACLPDVKGMRENLVPYYESVHRGDACIGGVLRALEESGQADHTMIIFLSDHGMGVPGAKNMLYQDGTRTPIIFKLPGKTAAGRVDERSIVSAIDIMPTVIEACGLPPVKGIEGQSIHEVLTGARKQAERTHALTTFDYWGDSTEAHFYPQRSIINGDYCYIWNSYVQRYDRKKVVPMPWNDVVEPSMKHSQKLVERIAAFKARPVEEFYDLSKDPGCWNNLIDDEAYREKVAEFRSVLKQEMERTKDPERFFYKPPASGSSK